MTKLETAIAPAATDKAPKLQFLTAAKVVEASSRLQSSVKKEAKPLQTNGILLFTANSIELTKAIKNKDTYFTITTGLGQQTFKSNPTTSSGPLQLKCDVNEVMKIDVKDST